MKKEILFITATHGNEPIGVEIIKKLEKNYNNFDWIVGNPLALKLNKRNYQGDLNRSAPGNPNSSKYAQKRAYKIIKLSKQYKYCIDIHGSSKNTGVFIIITNPTPKNFKLATMLDIDKIVIIPPFCKELKGPLSEFFTCGLEIECGKKNDLKIKKELQDKLSSFLTNYKTTSSQNWEKIISQKEIYLMYDKLTIKELKKYNISKEWKKITTKQSTFYPLFIGSYQSTPGYKLKRLNHHQSLLL